VYSGKVALPGRMLAVGSIMVVAGHSAESSATMVTASKRWVPTSEATTVASEIAGATFALTSMADSSVVA
jgi:hypothetical protein